MPEPTLPEFLSTPTFLKRLSRNLLFGTLVIVFSLGIGMLGYHHIENLSWIDSYENAAMILSGMGPTTEMKTSFGKLFAGTYALFSGIIFLVVIAIVFAPVIHRFFHYFHLNDKS